MFNIKNIVKYLILFIIVSLSTYMIPNCRIMNLHAFYIGLLAGTTFILLDKFFPHTIIVYDDEKDNIKKHF